MDDAAIAKLESVPPQIRRDYAQRLVVIQANVEGEIRSVSEIQQRIETETKLTPGYSVTYGGQFENQQCAQARLMIVVPNSLGLI